MRVIAGSARSLPLKTPSGLTTRPTSDRIKETLFNMLQGDLLDATFLDLFAGSGGIGIEALSRGVSKCYFVDNDAVAIQCINENLEFTKLKEQGVVLKQDVASAITSMQIQEVDIVYMDPPYQLESEETILTLLNKQMYITQNTIIIIEADLNRDFSFIHDCGFVMNKEKKYKTNKHIFLTKI